MHPLYLTETSETRTNYLESEHFSTLRPTPQLVSRSLGARMLKC
jgi:hypothetical protein